MTKKILDLIIKSLTGRSMYQVINVTLYFTTYVTQDRREFLYASTNSRESIQYSNDNITPPSKDEQC